MIYASILRFVLLSPSPAIISSGSNISSSCCSFASWQHWIYKRERNWLICAQRWKILVSSANCCWTFYVRKHCKFAFFKIYSLCTACISYPLCVNSLIYDFPNRCDAKALEDSLCKRVIVTRDENITKWLDPEAAALSRDALAKIVYTRLFDW